MVFSCKFGNTVFVLFTLFAIIANAKKSPNGAKKLSTANNKLALKLYKILAAQPDGNVIFSPFSLSAAFGMLFNGAKGKTAEELKTVLGFQKEGLSNEQFHATFKDILKDYTSSKDSEIILNSANLILASKNLKLLPKYKDSVKKLYQAKVKEIDFKKGNSVVDEVNQWVKKKTHGKIEKMVDNFNEAANVMILNAIYFKGKWKQEFKNTKLQKFYNDGSKSKKVPMMFGVGSYLYAENDDFKVLELPYKGEQIAMVVFLPKAKDGLQKLEKGLKLKDMYSLLQKLQKKTVSVHLPKFKLKYEKKMGSEFRTLGAKRTFGSGTADFSGITSSHGVFINEILHKAVIEVSEEGAEAAASSSFIYISSDNDKADFKADHPFFFVIFDKKTTMAFFAGRVSKL